MTGRKLEGLTVDQLVQRFIDIAFDQAKAEPYGDLVKMRSLYWEMDAVANELRARPGDQRRALVPLLRHGNIQVMMKAALSTLALEPKKARLVLEAISLSGRQPQALEAGTSLAFLDDGTSKPT
ncbi:MAG: DUF2019 domain-containing protein [Bauldia sp.]|nr:DUF2019 domain-containing protein [Bauldia sp.]